MDSNQRIRPFRANRRYWQYKGKPVLLLGGSVEDNLFQIPDIEGHLDLLQSVGGNYFRCTMSCRDEGNVWPFEQNADGLYDLDKPSAEFWRRFETFIGLTAERDIIVQIEIWATFDFSNAFETCWPSNPYNPRNNVNYTSEQSNLPEKVDRSPLLGDNLFFYTVPEVCNNELVLCYQHAFVDRLLSHTLPRAHVLYCMDNETHVWPQWGAYWSEYIKAAAIDAGTVAQTTEMWRQRDVRHPEHWATLHHPETYSFVDVSQNGGTYGQLNYDRAVWVRGHIGRLRPINNVKIYGCDDGPEWRKSARDGIERFWRNIFAGHAASRFHRPPGGLGLSEKAQANIRSLRMLTDEINPWDCEPAGGLLFDCRENQAYCLANAGVAYAVFFTDGGQVGLDVSAVGGAELILGWLDISQSNWSDSQIVAAPEGRAELSTPGAGLWAALVKTCDCGHIPSH